MQNLDLDKVFTLPKTTKIGGSESALPLREIVSRLKSIYCSSIGLEYMFIPGSRKCKLYPVHKCDTHTSCIHIHTCIYVYGCAGIELLLHSCTALAEASRTFFLDK